MVIHSLECGNLQLIFVLINNPGGLFQVRIRVYQMHSMTQSSAANTCFICHILPHMQDGNSKYLRVVSNLWRENTKQGFDILELGRLGLIIETLMKVSDYIPFQVGDMSESLLPNFVDVSPLKPNWTNNLQTT